MWPSSGSTERGVSFNVISNGSGEIEGVDWVQITKRRVPRIGPLFASSTPADPDSGFARSVMTALQQLADGGNAVVESKLLTSGARAAFAQANPQMRNVRGATFVHSQNLTGRGIERHGSAIVRTLQYRLDTDRGVKLLLVFVDASGLIGDYDLVNR